MQKFVLILLISPLAFAVNISTSATCLNVLDKLNEIATKQSVSERVATRVETEVAKIGKEHVEDSVQFFEPVYPKVMAEIFGEAIDTARIESNQSKQKEIIVYDREFIDINGVPQKDAIRLSAEKRTRNLTKNNKIANADYLRDVFLGNIDYTDLALQMQLSLLSKLNSKEIAAPENIISSNKLGFKDFNQFISFMKKLTPKHFEDYTKQLLTSNEHQELLAKALNFKKSDPVFKSITARAEESKEFKVVENTEMVISDSVLHAALRSTFNASGFTNKSQVKEAMRAMLSSEDALDSFIQKTMARLITAAEIPALRYGQSAENFNKLKVLIDKDPNKLAVRLATLLLNSKESKSNQRKLVKQVFKTEPILRAPEINGMHANWDRLGDSGYKISFSVTPLILESYAKKTIEAQEEVEIPTLFMRESGKGDLVFFENEQDSNNKKSLPLFVIDKTGKTFFIKPGFNLTKDQVETILDNVRGNNLIVANHNADLTNIPITSNGNLTAKTFKLNDESLISGRLQRFQNGQIHIDVLGTDDAVYRVVVDQKNNSVKVTSANTKRLLTQKQLEEIVFTAKNAFQPKERAANEMNAPTEVKPSKVLTTTFEPQGKKDYALMTGAGMFMGGILGTLPSALWWMLHDQFSMNDYSTLYNHWPTFVTMGALTVAGNALTYSMHKDTIKDFSFSDSDLTKQSSKARHFLMEPFSIREKLTQSRTTTKPDVKTQKEIDEYDYLLKVKPESNSSEADRPSMENKE